MIAAKNQQWLVRQRGLKRLRRALKCRLNAWRHVKLLLRLLDRVRGLAQRGAGREIERDGDDRELPLMVDGERRGARFEMIALRGRPLQCGVERRAGAEPTAAAEVEVSRPTRPNR